MNELLNNTVFIGNAVTFIGAIVMVLMGLIKTKRNFLIAQCVQCAIMGVGNLILGGVTGFVTNLVTITRNLFSIKKEIKTVHKLIFIAIQLLFGAIWNNLGLIGWMPVFAGCIFTWFLDIKSDLGLKLIVIVTQMLWIIFDVSIQNYVSVTMDIFSLISNTIGIIMIKRSDADKAKNEEDCK